MFRDLIIIIMTSVLVNNYVLSRFLGICPFLGVSKKTNQAFGMGVAVILVMMMSTLVTWPIQKYVLEPNGLSYLQTIVFILVIAALVQLVEMFLKKVIPSLHTSLGIYLPLITTNCAVLGVCKNSLTEEMLTKADTPQLPWFSLLALEAELQQASLRKLLKAHLSLLFLHLLFHSPSLDLVESRKIYLNNLKEYK